jgi:hypothetical protein
LTVRTAVSLLFFVLPSLVLPAAASVIESSPDPATTGCVPMERGYVGVLPGAPCNVWLPGSPVTAAVPAGWVCEAVSSSTLGDESVQVLTCLPTEGGSPVSLRKEFDARKPRSLSSLLDELSSSQAQLPLADVLMKPRLIEVAGRPAVEAATQSNGTVHYVSGGASEGTFISHTLTFEDSGQFYVCELSTTPPGYDAGLRRSHVEFCASVRFHAAAPLSGHL